MKWWLLRTRSSISPSPPVKKSTVPFSYTIFLFRMLTTHLITGYLSRERTNKHQCRCMMLMPQAPQKTTNELRVGHGYLVLQSCPHNLCLQIYLGVFFRNIWLSYSYSYIYYFFTHFWSNNLRKKNVLNPNPTLTFGASFISIQAFCNTGTLLRRKA